MIDDVDERRKHVFERVSMLLRENKFAEARNELGLEVARAQAAGNQADESAYRSMLASTFVLSGDDERALDEYRRAQSVDPRSPTSQLTTARQLLRMRRYEEAAMICRDVLETEVVDPLSRHEALATLGRVFLDSDLSRARAYLAAAQAVAEEANVPAILWDQMLAEAIARRGDPRGHEYLLALRANATANSESGTAVIVDEILRELGLNPNDNKPIQSG